MGRFFLLLLPLALFCGSASSTTETRRCDRGFQPYSDRCVSQRMADYISCVEASGGNARKISEVIVEESGTKAALATSPNSQARSLASGTNAAKVDKQSEANIRHRLEQEWNTEGMRQCGKVRAGPVNTAKRPIVDDKRV